jgi:pimeloyl-ACP methyl ester carboxylesterase
LLDPQQATTSGPRETVLAALNGVLGDHLAASENPLAIQMQLRRNGETLLLTPQGLAAQIPRPGGRILLLVHGLCMSDLQWRRNGHDHGAALARAAGFTPLYLHYNSGRHVSSNGHAFADLLESLLQAWPVPIEELVIVAHSMGGLLARSAFHYGERAGQAWPKQLRKLVFLGTPHEGAPLERGGNWVNVVLEVSPYTAALARLAKIRSAGITDLRHGSILDEDWRHGDRFAHARGRKHATPLPQGVQCFAVGVTIAHAEDDPGDSTLGDGLVPLRSALGQHKDKRLALDFPASHQWVGHGLNHMDLLDNAEVYAQLKRWLC